MATERIHNSGKLDQLGDGSGVGSYGDQRSAELGTGIHDGVKDLGNSSIHRAKFKERRSKRNGGVSKSSGALADVKPTHALAYNGILSSDKKSGSMLNLPTQSSKRRLKESRLYVSTPVLGPKHSPSESSPRFSQKLFKFHGKSATFPLKNMQIGDYSQNQSTDVQGLSEIGQEKLIMSDKSDVIDAADDNSEQSESHALPSADDRKKAAVLEAEEDVKHNWLLEEKLKESERRFKQRKNALSVHVPDEDPLVAIENRLDEVRQMAKPRRAENNVLHKVESNKRDYILHLTGISDKEFRAVRRRGWKLIDKFRWAARIIRLLISCFHHRRKYHAEKSDVGQLRQKMQKQTGPSTLLTQFSRSSVGLEMQLCLITQPHLRDSYTVKKVMWLLKATKAFQHLFPAEMEREVARYVSYEKYDDGRVIAFQGRTPDRFYYIIAGRVRLLRQIKLSTGQVTKAMGFLTKGMTTDPEEVEKDWLREDNLVAKGQVEVLVLEKKAYRLLQHTTQGPPVDFIRSLDLFDEFPVDDFLANSDAVEYKYYGQGKTIVRDSNRTPWLHVVKSGHVKVVRRQSVIDTRLSNEHKFSTPRAEKLGTGKYFSHADTMLGNLVKQRKGKAESQLSLPEINKSNGMNSSKPSSGVKSLPLPPSEQNATRVKKRKHVRIPRIDNSGTNWANPHLGSLGIHQGAPLVYRNKPVIQYDAIPEAEEESIVEEGTTSEIGSENERVLVLPAITKSHNLVEDDASSRASSTMTSDTTAKRRPTIAGPLVNIPLRENTEEDFHPHSLWLTRERTDAEGVHMGGWGEKAGQQRLQQQRKAYLQLDVLNPGDVFGLDHLQPALASEPRGVGLLSDGAEIIKISKRFFLQHAANNTMLKVETMYKEYMTEEEAKQTLYEQETWKQYKSALWQRLVAPMSVR